MKPTSFITLSLTAVFYLILTGCGGDTTSETTATPALTITAAFESDGFNKPSTCGGCHTDIFAQWQGSMLNNSFTDAFYQAVHGQASMETGGALDAFCTACHTPIGTFSGEVPPLEGPQISEVAKSGVQCDFCHTVTGTTGIGNFSFQFTPSIIKQGPYEDAVSPFHQTAYSELHTVSEFCGMCHNLNHPDNNLALEATYTEWENSPYAAEGIQCQDCHMTPGPGVQEPNPGKAAIGGPERQNVFTHFFVGGNATELASPEHQRLAREQLSAAAELGIHAPATASPSGTVELAVDVTNKGAGHYLPTGLTEIRQMWLEVTVTDATGKEVFHSGSLNSEREIDPAAVIFQTVFRDENGEDTHKPWKAVSIASDRRIPPRGMDTAAYSFNLPADAVLPLDVSATLHYRSASQSFVNEVMGTEAPEFPVVDMTSATARIG